MPADDVLAVPAAAARAELNLPPRGFVTDPGPLFSWLARRPERVRLLPRRERADWERDDGLKQLVAYVVVRQEGLVLAYERLAGDPRIVGRRSIGWAGHAEHRDLAGGPDGLAGALVRAADRELVEELEINPPQTNPIAVGVVNDDLDPRRIGRCHLGIVFIVDLDPTARIGVAREPDNRVIGFFAPGELARRRVQFETWSTLVVAALEAGLDLTARRLP